MEQFEGLSSKLAEAVGGEGYAAEIIQGDQTLVFGDAVLVRVALEGLGGMTGLTQASPLATGVFASNVLTALFQQGLGAWG